MNNFFGKRFYIPFLLLITCLIAYLPVSSLLFALKNDAFVYNFPNKHFFSESLQHGYIPFWNPYLNFGFPLYADPGFAWWNPITWLFGLIGYNAYTFSIEIIFYIYLSGLGMYRLGKIINLSTYTSFVIGSMFMCSGFFIGNLQHINFITCAAFLPWLMGSWLLFQKKPGLKNLFYCCISAYLLCTGGHPAIPLATAFFFIILTILYPVFIGIKERLVNFIFNQVTLLIAILVFLSPLLLSYWHLLPFYSRFDPVNQSENVHVGFTAASYISFLFPFSTIKNYTWFLTDVSMRNAYFTIPGFLLFLMFLSNKQKNGLQIIYLISGLLMLLLSAGGTIKEIIYTHLPFFSSIRTNGEFRVFAIFCFSLCSSFELERLFNAATSTSVIFSKLLKALIAISFFCSVLLLFHLNKNIFLPHFKLTTINGIKDFIDHTSFWQSVVISLLICGILASGYLWALSRKDRKKLFMIFLLIDIFINCWLLLPITGVGKTSVAQMQRIINKSPEGFPSPLNFNRGIKIGLTKNEEISISNWSWYDKKIVHPKIDYPSELQSTKNFYQSSDTLLIKDKPFIFSLHQFTDTIQLVSFTPNSFDIKLSTHKPDTLIILQNSFPGWSVLINSVPVPYRRYAQTFIAIPIDENSKEVYLTFSPF